MEHGKGTLFDVGEELVVPALAFRNTALLKLAIVRVNKKTGAVVATLCGATVFPTNKARVGRTKYD